MPLKLVGGTASIEAGNLIDVPRTLRGLADAIETEGDPIPHCVIVVWFQNGDIEIASAGMRSDGHDTHMLLTAAAQQLVQQTFG